MKNPEQLDPTRGPKEKRDGKKHATRQDRRAAKTDPENAPKKRRYRGYVS